MSKQDVNLLLKTNLKQLRLPTILAEHQKLARCAWIQDRKNCLLEGTSGTGKTHLAIALGLAACRAGLRVRFFTAAVLVNRLEEARKQYSLDRFLQQLDKMDLLICDELGYLSFSRSGAELLFQVFADRYERASLLITSNLPFSEWQQVFQGESFRFRESMKKKQTGRNK